MAFSYLIPIKKGRVICSVFVLIVQLGCIPNAKESNGSTTNSKSKVEYYKSALDNDLELEKRLYAINTLFSLTDPKKDTLFMKGLHLKSHLFYYSNQIDSLIAAHKKFLTLIPIHTNHRTIAKQYYLMGYYYDYQKKEPDKAFSHYNNSKRIYEIHKDSTWIGKCLLNMGTIQKDQNDFFGSKETLTEALKYLHRVNDQNDIASCYNFLGVNHRKLLNFEEAISSFNLAIELTPKGNQQNAFLNNLAMTYADLTQYDQAMEILGKLLKDSNLKPKTAAYARIMDNLAYAQWLAGESISDSSFLAPLKLRKETGDKRGQIASHTRLGEFYTQSHPKKAIAHLDTVIQLAHNLKMPKAEQDALKLLIKIRPKDIALRDRYDALRDSLYAQELLVKTQFAKYKYDDKLKQESILRLEKESAEKALEASTQRNYKIVFVLFLILAVLSGTFFINRQIQKNKLLHQRNKTAQLVATQETETRLSQRLHDDFGAGLNQAMILVQKEAPKDAILDTLERLDEQSRDFSREINDVDTGPDFWPELQAMLRLRTDADKQLLLNGGGEIPWASVTPLTKRTIYKVLQELMINMGKHSGASLVVLSFQRAPKKLDISYFDNGKGASEQDIFSRNGLRNTEKRIQALDGTLTFDTETNGGFSAHIYLPV